MADFAPVALAIKLNAQKQLAAKSCEEASRFDSNVGVCVQSLADVTLQREVYGFGSKESVSALFASPKRVSNHSSHVCTWSRVPLFALAITSALLNSCCPMSARANFS